MSREDTKSMALFCDFENVALGVKDAKYDRFDIRKVLERLLLKGSIVVKKAYCDWERYREFKAPMHEASFELIEIPHVRMSGKNSADIRMVVDALDLCYTKSHVDTFVIISGDSDFSPLVSKLRENNKMVIGVGVKNSTSDLLIANCDEFIYYDDLVRAHERGRNGRGRTRAVPPRGTGRTEPAARGDGGARHDRGAASRHALPPDVATPDVPLDGVTTVASGADTGGAEVLTSVAVPAPVQFPGGEATTAVTGATQDAEADVATATPAADGAATATKARRTPARKPRTTKATRAVASVEAAGEAGSPPPDEGASSPADGQGPVPADEPAAGTQGIATAADDGKPRRTTRRTTRKARDAEPVTPAQEAAATQAVAVARTPGEWPDATDAPDAIEAPAEASAPRRRGARATSTPAVSTAPAPAPAEELALDRALEALDLVVDTIEALAAERGVDDKIWGSMVKQTLKRRRPGFNEAYYGFRSFNRLLEEARDRGMIELELDEKSGGYTVRSLA